MDNTLDASLFASSPEIYETEFKNILTKITTCYQMMVKDKVRVPNNENKIRDILYNNYLNNNTIRAILKLTYYIFDCEVAEYDKDGNAIGFLDYKISTQNTFIESNSYYSIECKRLDDQNITGATGLNAKYIQNGIMRFVTGQYLSHTGINGMIGFIVARMNIADNIKNINRLLKDDFKNANTTNNLKSVNFIKTFTYSYCSTHGSVKEKEIKLYHLMFDFSKNMEQSN